MKKIFKTFFSVNPVSITFLSTLLVVILFFIGIPILDLVELKTYDLRFISRGQIAHSPAVVMAVIDEKSLDTEGRWPWPRTKIAHLIEALSRDGAKVIGFDIGFLEPDENTNLQFINRFDRQIRSLQLRDSQLNAFVEKSKIEADNDLALARAIERSSARVVLGYFFHMSQAGLDYEIDQAEIQKQLKRIDNSRYPLIRFASKDIYADPFITAYAPEGNLQILSDSSDASGYFNMFTDPDGLVRWMPLVIRCGEEVFSPLSIQSVWQYWNRPQLMARVASYGIEGIQIGDRFIPTDENGQMLINYLGPAKTFPHYSIGDILKGALPAGTFKDKIVLVGATAIGIYDLRNTPFSPIYPGLEIHATVIDNIIKGNFMHKPKWTRIYDLLAIVIIGCLAGLAVPRTTALRGLLFSLALFTLHLLITQRLFVNWGTWVNIVYPLFNLLVVFTSLTLYHYVTEEREKKKIRGAFSYYVSSSVVNEMLKDPTRLKLGGDKRDLTVLFSDIRGFTTISEGLTPEELVHLLNEYLTVMTDIVFKYEGTLDKYMGDAVMAIYGAPLEQPDHPARACSSALEMMEGLKKLNEKWIREGKKPLDIGIGINTGMMMVGNMGSEQRFDYTVMGDAVNLGSRLEGANKNYQTNILVSEFTYERIRDEFICMELDSVRVKGKKLPVRIYQLVGDKGVSGPRREAIERFHEGLRLYKQQEWDRAMEAFQAAADLDEKSYVSQLYMQRSRDLKA
ncbi:MAG: adenylate/guanylate cyclase domain-containing protein, partial [Deltaproteobacteria bacterium]|nr:adenylate/guanylate cyclase domain-containing protein [Deltaproteobacteria bacterium]